MGRGPRARGARRSQVANGAAHSRARPEDRLGWLRSGLYRRARTGRADPVHHGAARTRAAHKSYRASPQTATIVSANGEEEGAPTNCDTFSEGIETGESDEDDESVQTIRARDFGASASAPRRAGEL